MLLMIFLLRELRIRICILTPARETDDTNRVWGLHRALLA